MYTGTVKRLNIIQAATCLLVVVELLGAIILFPKIICRPATCLPTEMCADVLIQKCSATHQYSYLLLALAALTLGTLLVFKYRHNKR